MNGKLTTPFFTGLLLLAGSFVLAYIIVVFYSRAQVAHLMGRGISPSEFAEPYLFFINRGALIGFLSAIGTFVYWRFRLHFVVDTGQFFATHTAFIRFTMWYLPLLVAIAGAFVIAFYLQQTYKQPQ